jgi:DNA polymerase-3 subunit delta
MQLRPEQLAAHLDKPLAPLYLLHGDEPLLVIEAADAIRAAARKQGFEEREVIVVGTGFKWDELFMAAGNLSLFGGSSWSTCASLPASRGARAARRCSATSAPWAPGIVTLITLPELDWQAKKAAWVTALSNAGVAIECNAPPLARLPQWIAERLARQQQSAPRPRWSSSPPMSRATCSPPTRKSRSWACSIRPGEISPGAGRVRRAQRRPLRCGRLARGAEESRYRARRAHAGRPQGRGCGAAAGALGAGHRGARGAAAPTKLRALLHAAKIDRMIKGLARGDIWDEFLQLALRLTQTGTR